MSEAMDNIAGLPVEGKNFFGRELEVRGLLESLQQHDVLLLGARRIGKTSLARRVMVLAKEGEWLVVEVNVAACKNEAEVLTRLNTSLASVVSPTLSKIKSSAGKVISRLPLPDKLTVRHPEGISYELGLSGRAPGDWTASADTLFQLLGQATPRLLVYIDELPIFLFNLIKQDKENGVARVRRFLDWFRNDLRGASGTGTVRWLLTGSVGLDNLVQQHGMADTINTLRHKNLDPFSASEAIAFLQILAANYNASLSTAEALAAVNVLRWPQPYYLQLFFHEWRDLGMAPVGTDPQSWAEQIMQQMTASANNDFQHWEERLSIQLSPTDAGLAQTLLDHSSHAPQGGRAETLFAFLHEQMPHASDREARQTFSRLRDVLVRDAYWFADESSGDKYYRFCLEPLRRWWARRNSL